MSIVIVAHNSADALRKLLPSLDAATEIIVVDNASNDGLAEILGANGVKLVRNPDNVGYGAACNRGATVASGEFVVFVNPDIEVTAATFDALRAAAERYLDGGVFVPRIEDRAGTLLVRDHNFIERQRERVWIRHPREATGDCCIHSIHGAMFMVRKSTFLAAGGFDERIFLYYEDDDLAWRLVSRETPIIYVDGARAIHREQESSAASARRSIFMGFHKKRSEIYVRRKYGLAYSANRDLLRHLASIPFYLVTLRFGRLLSALGRMRGILSMRLPSHAPVAES